MCFSSCVSPTGYRLAIDYTMVNSAIMVLKFPLTPINEILSKLQSKIFFAKLDVRLCFHQILMDTDSRYLTAFYTPTALKEFLRVPFGLKNGSIYFQQQIAKILSMHIGIICYVFIDDIIIFADTFDDFVENCRMILTILLLRIAVLKCKFGFCGIYYWEYLDHMVEEFSNYRDPKGQQINVVPSINFYGVQSIIDSTNEYRYYFDCYHSARGLLQRTRENRVVEWGQMGQITVDQFKLSVGDEVDEGLQALSAMDREYYDVQMIVNHFWNHTHTNVGSLRS